jgi:hypothetical protein
MESESYHQNRREFKRVDAYIPIEFRLVPEDERRFVKSRLSDEVALADFHRMPLPEKQPQQEWIVILNAKLDRIIQALTLQSKGFHALTLKFVTISGNGLSFSSPSGFAPGDLLEIKMMLNLYKPAAFYIYGEVIKARRQESGYLISVSFRMTDEAIRDHIIRFVFEAERELLRERCGME